MSEPSSGVPTPGREGAPDSTSDPDGGDVSVDRAKGKVTRKEESGVGPGAGEGPIVKVTAPIEREDDDPTQHPTLREGDSEGASASRG